MIKKMNPNSIVPEHMEYATRKQSLFNKRHDIVETYFPPHNPASSYGITVWNGEAHSLNFAEQ